MLLAFLQIALGRRIGFYRFCGDIGRGNFSRVKLAVHQLTRGKLLFIDFLCIFLFISWNMFLYTSDKVAIKVVDRGRLDTRALRMLAREVSTLECVHHPNILRYFSWIIHDFFFIIILFSIEYIRLLIITNESKVSY